jgi:hypothetical protein
MGDTMSVGPRDPIGDFEWPDAMERTCERCGKKIDWVPQFNLSKQAVWADDCCDVEYVAVAKTVSLSKLARH